MRRWRVPACAQYWSECSLAKDRNTCERQVSSPISHDTPEQGHQAAEAGVQRLEDGE